MRQKKSQLDSSRKLNSTEEDDSSFDNNMETDYQVRSYRVRQPLPKEVGISSSQLTRKTSSTLSVSQPKKAESNLSESIHKEVKDDCSYDYEYATKLPWHHAIINFIQPLRLKCGMIVNMEITRWVVIILISGNALMLGIATYPFIRNDPYYSNIFALVDEICLIIFTIELFMQFIFHGWRLFIDGWLVFDIFIIVISWAASGISIARAFRIIRAFRLITRVKVMKNLIVALFGVVPRLFAISLLLMLVSYIFAVMFTELFKNLYAEGVTDWNYFGRLDMSLFTLFQIMTEDSWADLTRMIMTVKPWAWLPIVVYVVMSAFVVANLIIAVVCDAIYALRDDDKAKLHGGRGHNNDIHELIEGESVGGDEKKSEPSVARDDLAYQLDELESHVERLANTHEEILETMNMFMKQLAALHQIQEMYEPCDQEDDYEDDDYVDGNFEDDQFVSGDADDARVAS